jgi:hypothetical protein
MDASLKWLVTRRGWVILVVMASALRKYRWLLGAAALVAATASLVVLLVESVPREPELKTFGVSTTDKWIEHATRHLKAFVPSRREPSPEVSFDGTLEFDFEGFLRFGDGGWVYVIRHPWHGEQHRGTFIGDIAMAIDDEGNLYVSFAHQCGPLTLDAPDGLEFACAKEFFATPVHWGRPPYWKPLDEVLAVIAKHRETQTAPDEGERDVVSSANQNKNQP